MTEKINENVMLIIIVVAIITGGGFFDYSVFLLLLLIIGALLFAQFRKEKIYKRDKAYVFLIPMAILTWSIAVSFWSVDYIENLLGSVRILLIILWMKLIISRREGELLSIGNKFPQVIAILNVLGLLGVITPFRSALWENDRFAGFVQYSNTWALLCSIALLMFLNPARKKSKNDIKGILCAITNLVALLLTGSRSVLMLFILYAVIIEIKNKRIREVLLVAGIGIAIIGLITVFIPGSSNNIGRITSIFTSNSTVIGRVLYARDALSYFPNWIFGMGRMGYYYEKGLFQSGVYSVRYVHNDFLQMALDYGVIGFALLLCFILWQLWKGKQDKFSKVLLSFIAIACLMDFHLQYSIMGMIAALFLDYGNPVLEKERDLRENYIIYPVGILVSLYFFAATFFARVGNYYVSLSMFPSYTYAEENMLIKSTDVSTSYNLANTVLGRNRHNSVALMIRGYIEANEGSIESFMEDYDLLIELNPYEVSLYEQYMSLLDVSSARANVEEQVEIENKKIELPQILDSRKERTSKLAYKIKDVPIFTME